MSTYLKQLVERNPDNTCPKLSRSAEKAPRFSDSAETVYYEEKTEKIIKFLFKNLPDKEETEEGTYIGALNSSKLRNGYGSIKRKDKTT